VITAARAFDDNGARTYSSVDVPETVTYEKALDEKLLSLDADKQKMVDELLDAFWHLLVTRGVKHKRTEFARPIVISDSGGRHILVQCISRQKSSPFTGEFIVYDQGFSVVFPDTPFTMKVNADDDVYPIGKPLFQCFTELDMAKYFVEHGVGPFRFRIATQDFSDGAVGANDCIKISSIGEYLDIQEIRENNLLLAKTMHAFKMFKNSKRPWYQKRKRTTVAGDKTKTKAKFKEVKHAALEKEGAIGPAEESSDSGRSVSSRKVAKAFTLFKDEDNKKILRESLRHALNQDDSDASSSGAEHCAAGPEDGPPPPPFVPVVGSSSSSAPPPVVVLGGSSSSSAALPPHMPMPAQSLDDFVIDLEDGRVASIKIDRRRKQFNAHCGCLGPPPLIDHTTDRTDKCTLNRKAHKAPLGMLISWLRLGFCYTDRKDHYDAHAIITKEDREEARDWLNSCVALLPLLEYEAFILGIDIASVREPTSIA
jgi:hypothetical protein